MSDDFIGTKTCDSCGKQASPVAYERNKQWLCHACWIIDLNSPPDTDARQLALLNANATIVRQRDEITKLKGALARICCGDHPNRSFYNVAEAALDNCGYAAKRAMIELADEQEKEVQE